MDVPIVVPAAARASRADALADHLRSHGCEYLAGAPGPPADVVLLGARRQRFSTLYRFRVAAHGRTGDLLVKARHPGDAPPSPPGPCTAHAPDLAPEAVCRAEYAALRAVRAHFDGLADPRLGAVRVFALVPEQRALVMEYVSGPTLREEFRRASRLRPGAGGAGLEAAFTRAGAWLRAFHAVPDADGARPRHTTCDELVRFVGEAADHLAGGGEHGSFLRSLGDRAQAAARHALADPLPLCVAHGDYGLSNVIVGAGARVTAVDTLRAWRTAAYEDVGFFLVSFKTTWPQLLSLGAAYGADFLARCERAFLSGYFGDQAIPWHAVRLYEVRAMLLKWLSAHARATRGGGLRRRAEGALRVHLLRRHLRGRIDESLRTLGS